MRTKTEPFDDACFCRHIVCICREALEAELIFKTASTVSILLIPDMIIESSRVRWINSTSPCYHGVRGFRRQDEMGTSIDRMRAVEPLALGYAQELQDIEDRIAEESQAAKAKEL